MCYSRCFLEQSYIPLKSFTQLIKAVLSPFHQLSYTAKLRSKFDIVQLIKRNITNTWHVMSWNRMASKLILGAKQRKNHVRCDFWKGVLSSTFSFLIIILYYIYISSCNGYASPPNLCWICYWYILSHILFHIYSILDVFINVIHIY